MKKNNYKTISFFVSLLESKRITGDFVRSRRYARKSKCVYRGAWEKNAIKIAQGEKIEIEIYL